MKDRKKKGTRRGNQSLSWSKTEIFSIVRIQTRPGPDGEEQPTLKKEKDGEGGSIGCILLGT